jgi:hypothetical protein
MNKFISSIKTVFYKVASVWENPFLAGAIALIVSLAYALHTNPTLGHTPNNYHNYLADAF